MTDSVEKIKCYLRDDNLDQVKSELIILKQSNASEAIILHIEGLIAEKNNQLTVAINYYEQSIAVVNENISVYLDLSRCYFLTHQFAKIIQLLKPIRQQLPNHIDVLHHISSAQFRLSDLAGYYQTCKQVVALKRKVLETELVTLQCINMATCLSTIYSFKRQLLAFIHLIKQINESFFSYKTYRTNLAFAKLSCSELESAWINMEARSYPESYPKTYNHIFNQIPYWRGEALEGKSLLILAEQGIGDELMHSNTYSEVIKQTETCYITCDQRLGKLFQLSFGNATIIPTERNNGVANDILTQLDYVMLGGTGLCHLRKQFEDFPTKKSWINLDQTKLAEWQAYLADLSGKHKVGLAWRSVKQRNNMEQDYFSLTDLIPILRQPDVTFINLQYDDVTEDIAVIMDQYQIEIHRPPINIKQDIYDLAHIVKQLDLVITPFNFNHALAGSLGTQTCVLEPALLFPFKFGLEHSVFYPTMRFYKCRQGQRWQQAVAELAIDMPQLLQNET